MGSYTELFTGSKNWFYGADNGSVGGIYAFDSIENAQKYVTDYFPTLNSSSKCNTSGFK